MKQGYLLSALCLGVMAQTQSVSLTQANLLSIAQVISLIDEKNLGVITELELETYRGQTIYDIEVIDPDNGTKSQLKLHAQSGKQLTYSHSTALLLGLQQLDSDERRAIKDMQNSGLNLAEALTQLEQAHQAQVLDIELEHRQESSYYEVELKSPEGWLQQQYIRF